MAKIYYYGVDSATKNIHFWGVDSGFYTGTMDEETGEWVLAPFTGALPPVMFATSYRILDSDGKQLIYQVNGQNYLGEYSLTRYGGNSYIFGVNNAAPTSLSQLASTSTEDQMAKAAANPLVPILLIAAAYWIFIR